jgi:AcrR family transcriptional regulator
MAIKILTLVICTYTIKLPGEYLLAKLIGGGFMRSSLLHRKERVILTAIEIIDELGLQGLSTKEIAKRQGISEGTLFKHFRSKNEIILSVLDYFTQYDNDIYASIQLKNMRPVEGLTFYIDSYATYYENYPAITAITQMYDILQYDPDLADKVHVIFNHRLNLMKQIIENAQTVHEIIPEVDSEMLADIITGTFRALCLKWRMNNQKFSLRSRMMITLKTILDTFSTKKSYDTEE